ncbi:MAG: molybdenum cofactor biosynthesis protein MoaE [Armatimonadota bacterium]|nr:molybdenum cofactor biosynthesis protein MoaE [Armatimonadota bacterium]MDR5697731.1 molybdenum cofactor biosynthesis protein MoaE [Armatimonadota bacterium]
MRVRVRLFASYRETVGSPSIDVHLDGEATPEAVWAALIRRYPALAGLATPAFAVNDEYAPANRPLRDGEEVALIPPVSGGDIYVAVQTGPISTDDLLERVRDPGAGAVVLFLGTVRQTARNDQRVVHLEYEAYERLARSEMERIARQIAERWPVLHAAIVHRTGRLGVGEISVAVAVSSAHRKDAFEAAKYAIDTLKVTVPIWKKEVWEGGAAWVGTDPVPGPAEGGV